MFFRVTDVLGELTKPVRIQDTCLSLNPDPESSEDSVITYIDDAGNEGSCRVRDVVCVR